MGGLEPLAWSRSRVGALRKLAFIAAMVIGGPTLLAWVLWAVVFLHTLGLVVEMVHFVAAHAVAVGLGLLGAVAFLGGLLWRPRATVTVVSALIYAVMALKLFGGVR